MAKRDALRLSQHQFIETGRDWNGRFFIAYSGGASVFIRETKELRKFLKIPKGIEMRASLDSWLTSLEAMDAERAAKRTATDTFVSDTGTALSPELLSTGFGPECHLDESDPNHQTKTII